MASNLFLTLQKYQIPVNLLLLAAKQELYKKKPMASKIVFDIAKISGTSQLTSPSCETGAIQKKSLWLQKLFLTLQKYQVPVNLLLLAAKQEPNKTAYGFKIVFDIAKISGTSQLTSPSCETGAIQKKPMASKIVFDIAKISGTSQLTSPSCETGAIQNSLWLQNCF